jgi:hypothetical protein
MCRENRRGSERQRRWEHRYADQVKGLNQLVDELRSGRGGDESIPYVDPDSGGVGARVLLLMQDPGPKASVTTGGSGFLSWDNDDDSAERICLALAKVGLSWAELVPWNTVPWYTGGTVRSADKQRGGLILRSRLVPLLPKLMGVVTMGNVAHGGWEQTGTGLHLRHFRTFHTSGRGITNGGQQTKQEGLDHVEGTFRAIKAFLEVPEGN